MLQTLRSTDRWVQGLPTLATFSLVVGLDQLTKHLVRERFFLGESWPADWPARLTYVENSGSAFGFFHNQTAFLIVASIIAIGMIMFLFRQAGSTSLVLRVCLGMMLGGGISNLADRIRFGSVTDFFDLRVWPIFNVADSSVVVGITILAVVLFFQERKSAKAPR